VNEELCIYFYYRSFILYIISMILYSITLFIVEGVGGRVVSTCTSLERGRWPSQRLFCGACSNFNREIEVVNTPVKTYACSIFPWGLHEETHLLVDII
jgi:hypothetical protein